MKILPKAKIENIVVNSLKNELLVYDLTTNQAFCLNDTSAKVFNACDGKTTFDELKNKYQLTDEIIYLALDGLKKENLLSDKYVSPFAGLSRRQLIQKVGLASMIALPVISAVIAPQASQAASANANCVPLNQCFAAGTEFCPPGCNGTYNFIGYGTGNGTCGGNSGPSSIDCAANHGLAAPVDYRRIS